MQWALAIIGALSGVVLGAIDAVALGLVAGALLGWLGARLALLRGRIDVLERQLGSAAPAPAPASTASPGRPEATAASTAAAAPAPAPAPGPAAAAPREWSAPPRGPDLSDRLGALLRRGFLEGNVPAKVGILVTFVAVASLLRYGAEQGWFTLPIELRLAGIALAAIAALSWGWRNRRARPAFGLALQGGAIGALLLTSFAAFRLYALLPAAAALALVVVLVAAAAMLALLQDAVWLAALGFIGGYLAPVLMSTGGGDHVALFSYYAVLNAAVLAIAWRRPWRALNLIGFAFTFIVGLGWGARYYQPEHFATVEPFLLLFFLFYVAIPVLYALRREAADRRALVDGTLVFATPLLAFGLQAALLGDDRMALAFSALAVAALYTALAAWLLRRPRVALLGRSFAALAIGFATLAVPLALSTHWTAATWALEGAALVWVGLRQRQWLPQLAGLALQLLAGGAWLVAVLDGAWRRATGELLLVNGHFLMVLLLAGAALFIARSYERTRPRRWLVWPPFLLGLFWWTVACLREIDVHARFLSEPAKALAFATLSIAVAVALRRTLAWPRPGWAVLAAAAAGLLLAAGSAENADTLLLGRTGGGLWLLYFAVLGWALSALRRPQQRGLSWLHLTALSTVALAVSVALHARAAGEWALAAGWHYAALVAPLLLLVLATWRRPSVAAWPLAALWPRYAGRWFVLAGLALALLWLAGLANPGDMAPLPYVPLLGAVDLLQLALWLLLFAWLHRSGRRDGAASLLLAGSGLVLLTVTALRAVHHYAATPWSPAMFELAVTQATLTVVWSIAGVSAWVLGSRRRDWPVWLAGASMMGLVLVKLVLVDRQYVGNLGGIVSFFAVGVLLVLVGRLAPTPPRRLEAGP